MATRDDAVIEEMTILRNVAVEAVATRAVNLRIDLERCLVDMRTLQLRNSQLEEANKILAEELAMEKEKNDPAG